MYFIKDTRAENSELITIPDRITFMLKSELMVFFSLSADSEHIKNTNKTASIPKPAETSCMIITGMPNKIASAAPKEAAFATPIVSGVARGFENTA